MKTQKHIEEMNGVYTCSYGYNLCKKDVLELIEEIKKSSVPVTEELNELKERIERR